MCCSSISIQQPGSVCRCKVSHCYGEGTRRQLRLFTTAVHCTGSDKVIEKGRKVDHLKFRQRGWVNMRTHVPTTEVCGETRLKISNWRVCMHVSSPCTSGIAGTAGSFEQRKTDSEARIPRCMPKEGVHSICIGYSSAHLSIRQTPRIVVNE